MSTWLYLESSERKASIEELPRLDWPVSMPVGTVLRINGCERGHHTKEFGDFLQPKGGEGNNS